MNDSYSGILYMRSRMYDSHVGILYQRARMYDPHMGIVYQRRRIYDPRVEIVPQRHKMYDSCYTIEVTEFRFTPLHHIKSVMGATSSECVMKNE